MPHPPPTTANLDEKTAWDQREMPFTEHLRELRNRLVVCLATVGGLALFLFWPAQYAIPWLAHAYFPGVQLNAFGPADAILAEFRFSLYAAAIIGTPVLLFQLWMFVVPAIHPRTRARVYGYIAPSFILAAIGIAFAHFFVLPRVAGALIGITSRIATPVFGIEQTMNVILIMLFAFAAIFQTPVILVLLARIGLVNVTTLRTGRRYAALGFLVLGGFAAPDASPITMLMLATPMYVLYEISIWVIVILEKSWRRERLLP